MTTKKKVTAAELMRTLQSDPSFVAKRAQEEEERQKRDAEWHSAEMPLIQELQRAGVAVESAWDLVNESAPYPKALPILLGHLHRAYPGPVREGIARALAVPEAKFGWDVLVHLYREEQEERVKDGLAVALAAICDEELIEGLVALARDNRNGTSRLLLLSALERSSDPRAHTALVDLAADQTLQQEIRVILRRVDRRTR